MRWNGEPMWKVWRKGGCLKELHDTDRGEEEILGKLKEDDRISCEILCRP